MDSIKFISHDKQTQHWVKKFSEKVFNVSFSTDPQEALETLSLKRVDLIVYDTAVSPLTLSQFMEGLESRYLHTPVVMLDSSADSLSSIQKMFPDVVGHLSKPFSQIVFQDVLRSALEQYRKDLGKEFEQGRSMGKLQESQFFVGFRTHATIYKVSEQGMVLSLPIAIADGTRLLFKGKPLYHRMGIPSKDSNRIELVSHSCVPTTNHQYKVTALFKSEPPADINKKLEKYIRRNAGKCSALQPWNQTLLIATENEDDCQNYRFSLKEAGYRLVFSRHGKEVLEKLESMPIDMLIMDVDDLQEHLDFIFEDLQKVKTRVPFVLVSKQQGTKVVGKIAPFVKEFVVKPFSADELQKRLSKAIERWESELKLQEEIGENVGIYFNTRIVLAYQDSAIIDKVRKDGLLFFKDLPIVPGAWIYFNANTLFRKMGLKQGNISPLNLQIKRCERLSEDEPYRILANFGDLFSFQLTIDAFVDGLPLPEAEEINPDEIHADDLLDDFFVGFDDDFLVEDLDS